MRRSAHGLGGHVPARAATRTRSMAAQAAYPPVGFCCRGSPLPPDPVCRAPPCARSERRAVAQFDGFCLLLKEPHGPATDSAHALWPAGAAAGGAGAAGFKRPVRTPQYEALRSWLLEVTTGLLDPREPGRPHRMPLTQERRTPEIKRSWYSEVALLAPPRLTADSSQEQRFRYVRCPTRTRPRILSRCLRAGESPDRRCGRSRSLPLAHVRSGVVVAALCHLPPRG